MAMTHAQAVRGPSRLDPVGRDPAPSISPLGSAECDMAVTHARAVRGPGRRDPAGRDPAPSLSLLGSADSSTAATHAWALRGPSRARPGGEGPCSLPLAARHSRQLHGRDTRARRSAVPAGRDPAGKGPCPLPCRCWQSRQRHGRDTRTGGAWPGPGEIRRGRALPSPSCCSVLACSVSAVTHTQAVRSPSWARPGAGGLCSSPLAARRARHS